MKIPVVCTYRDPLDIICSSIKRNDQLATREVIEEHIKVLKQYGFDDFIKLDERYKNKLLILRFSGLYDSISQKNSLNVLHRNNAAKIINFFIEYTSLDHINRIFNCSEDQNEEASNISNSKLKKTGFIFDAYN